VLVDTAKLQAYYAAGLGRVMAARYGGSAEVWMDAYQRIAADWDSYYADLDLAGEDGIADLWEGLYRTTRALFRLTHTPEPPQAELTTLSRELPALSVGSCDVLYPDGKPVIERLHRAGLVLGVASHLLSSQARAILKGGGVLDFVTGAFITPDVLEQFVKDERFYDHAGRAAGVPAGQCAVIDANAGDLRGAKAAGMLTIHLRRGELVVSSESTADHVLRGDLRGLLGVLGIEG
jgi:FMN phosphatase YigB (HAD superfamily)